MVFFIFKVISLFSVHDFIPRLTLLLSSSYDHRVIDGTEAAKFCRSLALYLEDLKRVLLYCKENPCLKKISMM
ncbi:MAG: 2-oxo acid dehydrogenase subunit E2 [Spirochaetaceae bacterium]|nr:2-oxo acid dehydrogenase subunit E2 [Spirochaetaceae bacterium]